MSDRMCGTVIVQGHPLEVSEDLYDALWLEAERTGETIDEVANRCIRVGLTAVRNSDTR